MSIEFGRAICGDLSNAETREWLVTNGIGGYASGTVAGLLSRRDRGLLVAALQSPLDRDTHTNDWQMKVESVVEVALAQEYRCVRITADPHATPFYLSIDRAIVTPAHNGYDD